MNFKGIARKILLKLKNRYALTIIVMIVWVLFFDNNNIFPDRIKLLSKNKKLKKNIEYYQNEIIKDTKKMNELKTNDDNLEKFAREQYFMKKPNEDIFIIYEEE